MNRALSTQGTVWLSLLLSVLGLLWMLFIARPMTVADIGPDPDVPDLQPGLAAAPNAPALAGFSCIAPIPDGAPGRGLPPLCPPGEILRGRFSYTGHGLWFRVQRGDAPAFLLVSVDGEAASALNARMDRELSAAGTRSYLPLLSPFEHAGMRPRYEWISIHDAADSGPHEVLVEIHTASAEAALSPRNPFIEAVGIDLPVQPGRPWWPGLALILSGLASLALDILAVPRWPRILRLLSRMLARLGTAGVRWIPATGSAPALMTAICLIGIGAGQREQWWWLCLPGLVGLGLLGLARPAYWLGATLFGLPFYLYPLPLWPGFSLNLIEVGVWGGLALVVIRYWCDGPEAAAAGRGKTSRRLLSVLIALALVALVSALEAKYRAQAVREWRTVFLAGSVFLASLIWTLRLSRRQDTDILILLVMWTGGAVAVALFGYYAYLEGIFVTDVEGVRRIRGLYGSPNNLALYLERTLLVSMALLIYASSWRRRLLWGAAAAVQAGALVLTFSKGALLLGVPAGICLLFLLNLHRARSLPASRRAAWLLAGAAVIGILMLVPFLGTPRFLGLLDWRQSFPNFVRVHLWRSSLHMFLDHWLWGAGPDNFLYWYRGFYLMPDVWNEPSLNHPHNLPLDLLSRLGLVGFVCALGFWGVGFRSLWQQIAAHRPNPAAMGFAAAGTAGLAHGLVDASYALPDMMLIWVLLFGLWSSGREHAVSWRILVS